VAPLSSVKRALLAVILAALTLGPALPPNASAQESVRLAEQDIKAALLYNFLRYTQWPAAARAGEPAVVCVYGRDPFGGRLAPMAGRTVNQRTIEVRAVRSFTEADACTLLYLSADERARWADLRTHLGRSDVLTVSDYDGFARSGGMIEFTRTNNRIGVLINTGALANANLEVEDRLLRLARTTNGRAR
jgi:hypothetical protein